MNKKQLIEAYYKMLRIRMVEERLVREYLENNIRSFVHFYIGEEATAVGVCMNLTNQDYAFGTHRCHGHYLAKGGDLKRMIAELYGKSSGCCRGKGGSMHLVDKGVGYMGSISILASVAPIAVGAAFAQKYRGEDNITVVFVGDGAADEGGFYESVNLAALMKAPIVFVVENNLYAGMTPAEDRHPKEYNLKKIAEGLGVSYIKVDGNDLAEVYHAAAWARNNIDIRPCILECIAYRHMAHSAPVMDDKLGYRKLDPYETRVEACPIKNLKEELQEKEILTNDIVNGFHYKIEREINEAIRYAGESLYPKPGELTKGVYYE